MGSAPESDRGHGAELSLLQAKTLPGWFAELHDAHDVVVTALNFYMGVFALFRVSDLCSTYTIR